MSRRILAVATLAVLCVATVALRAQASGSSGAEGGRCGEEAGRNCRQALDADAHAVGRSRSAGRVGLQDDYAARTAREHGRPRVADRRGSDAARSASREASGRAPGRVGAGHAHPRAVHDGSRTQGPRRQAHVADHRSGRRENSTADARGGSAHRVAARRSQRRGGRTGESQHGRTVHHLWISERHSAHAVQQQHPDPSGSWIRGHHPRDDPRDPDRPARWTPALSPKIHQWFGDSRGHWEGDTLVVESQNFSDKTNYRGAGATLHTIERFTRLGKDAIDYRLTIDDPHTFVRPWTVALPMRTSEGDLYEYACHEANVGLYDILEVARDEEKAAAEAAKKAKP